jgi:Ca2+-binding RTX toxin-like protein
MIAAPLREPRPASPEPYAPTPTDEQAQRPATRPQIATGRPPRLNLDSLAIGAPLTAALIGILMTEGDAAFDDATAGVTDGAGAARREHDAESAASVHVSQGGGLDLAPEGLKGAVLGSTSGEILDPVAAEAAAALAAATGGAVDGTLAPPDGAPAGSVGDTFVSGDTSITFGAGAPLDEPGLGGGADVDGAQPTGRIGTVITGTDGDDVIHGTPFDDNLSGGAGNDTIFGHEGDDLLDGGAGEDQLFGGPGDDRLLGGIGNDGLFGGTGDDDLFGGSGNDRLSGEAGRDLLDGGSGNDMLDGGADPDRLSGGAGDDTLSVSDIHDVAIGDNWGLAQGGNNTLVVQAGFGTNLLEQLGEQRATFTFSENFGQALPAGVAAHRQQVAGDIQNITLEGSKGHDVVGDSRGNVIIGNAGDNQLYGGGGDDSLQGGGGNDGLHGGTGADELRGDAGNDHVFGGGGDDILHGGAGADILYGEPGADLLYGGAGNDNFVIGLNDSAVDTVFDLEGQNWLTLQHGAGHHVQTALVGDQLHVVVDDAVVALVDGYRGNEGALVGIDTGAGLRTIDELMIPGAPQDTSPVEASPPEESAASANDDLLGAYLTQPSLHGTAGDDYLVGTSDADWLVGGDGKDHLIGNASNDILEGGWGNDLLEGGAGDDRYLFKAGDGGFSTIIRDGEGSNVAELDGFAGASLDGRVVGQDLVVIANYAPLFTFEDFVGNQQAFAGVQSGDQFIPTEDLLA